MLDILVKTYAKPSRGHVKQLKDQFQKITKETRSIVEFMQSIKAYSDQLATLEKTIEYDDFIDRVLAGLNSSYTFVIDMMPLIVEILASPLKNSMKTK